MVPYMVSTMTQIAGEACTTRPSNLQFPYISLSGVITLHVQVHFVCATIIFFFNSCNFVPQVISIQQCSTFIYWRHWSVVLYAQPISKAWTQGNKWRPSRPQLCHLPISITPFEACSGSKSLVSSVQWCIMVLQCVLYTYGWKQSKSFHHEWQQFFLQCKPVHVCELVCS